MTEEEIAVDFWVWFAKFGIRTENEEDRKRIFDERVVEYDKEENKKRR